MIRFLLLVVVCCVAICARASSKCGLNDPPTWPERFSIVQNKWTPSGGGEEGVVTTYYDFPRGRNLILDNGLHDLELNNHSSYYFYPANKTCKTITMPVGVLRPDWLKNATSLGRSVVNGVQVFGFTKADFIDYYADAATCAPVRWYFHEMQTGFDTIRYEPNATVPDLSMFDPPSYCSGI